MANRKLRVLFKKIYTDGSIDTIFFKSRAKDVMANDDGSKTLADVVDKVDNVTEGATKTEASSTNGQLKIDGQEVTVYKHPNSGVTAGTYNKVTVNAQGHVTGASNVTDWTGTVSGNGSNETVTFTQATTRANLATGEKHSTMFGKISKWFADMKALAFVDKVGTSNLDTTLTTFYNNRVTTDKVTTSTSITEAGWVADARAVASLKNSIDSINSKMTKDDSDKIIMLGTSWSDSAPYTQTVEVAGVKTTDKIEIWSGITTDTSASDAKIYTKMAAMISFATCTEDDKITFTCLNKKPTSAFKIKLKGVA